MTVLPENIQAQYPDRSPGDNAHQDHHDVLHGETHNPLQAVPDGQVLARDAGSGFVGVPTTPFMKALFGDADAAAAQTRLDVYSKAAADAAFATLTPRPVNARNRGDADLDALGDGSGATLSARFGSLAEAQAKFPHATSLTQTIDWAALQSVLDVGSRVADIPPGVFNVGATGLILTKNVPIEGADPRKSQILAGSGMGDTTDVLTVAITENAGNTDVRNWRIKDLTIQALAGGRHALSFPGGGGAFPMLTSEITNLNLAAAAVNGGNAIHVVNQLSHSEISLCTFQAPIHMACYDANVIRKNMFFGIRNAITFDLELGVRNNTVADNTIVTRDGAVHIIEGDNVRIINNQIELAAGYTPSQSQSPVSAMVWVQGVARRIFNTVIEDNNFGGGTNLDHLIYVDRAEKTVIDKNFLIAVNVAEVYFTALSRYNLLGRRNFVYSQASNPRTRTRFKEETIDLGAGNMGVLHPASELAHQNGWVGGKFWKDEFGVVHFQTGLSAGAIADGTVIGVLPVGFRPETNTRVACPTSGGMGMLLIASTGNISAAGALPSNSIYPQSFTAAQTDF